MTDTTTWSSVDQYLESKLHPSDAALDATQAAGAAAGLPPIAVSPLQGRFLELIARSIGARNILEIGTLGGYSTIFLARSVSPGGRVITLEYDSRHAEIARSSIAAAGLSDIVDIRVGRALDLLPEIVPVINDDGTGLFDFVFIDADKASNADYLDWAIRLAHPGTVIFVDNVVRSGGVADANKTSADVQGNRRMFDLLQSDDRVVATAIQTVGSKGYDGFVYALVR
ncbi:MAG: O-methyltransferase [Nakamurella sp.]